MRTSLLIVLLILPAIPAGAGDCELLLVSVSPRDEYLRILDPEDASTIDEVEITLDTMDDVVGSHGLAVDPDTGDLYALLTVEKSATSRILVTIDPETGEATEIGDTGEKLCDLAFNSDGELFGLSADGADPPETLYCVDAEDGSVEELCTLGDGKWCGGEVLGYSPETDLLYHVSGYWPCGDVIFESVDDTSGDACEVTDIDISGTDLEIYPVALTWWAEEESFLWADGWDDFAPIPEDGPILYQVTDDAGDITEIGFPDHVIRGLAFVENWECEASFLRGDANGDGIVSGLGDGLYLLFWTFIEDSPAPPCMDAADANDNGGVSGLSDGVFLLTWEFVDGSPAPPDPGPTECGPDPTADDPDDPAFDLGCETPPVCN